jgi:cytochrome c556
MEEAGQTHITPWTASSNDFKANKDKLVHEAQLLAIMAQVIKDPSYEYGQDAKFVQFAEDLVNACIDIADGAKTDNYDKVRTAAGAMSKACNNCHGEFR